MTWLRALRRAVVAGGLALVALSTPAAWAEEAPVLTSNVLLRQRATAWLLAQPPPSDPSRPPPLLNAHEIAPTWLDRWERDLDFALTPGTPQYSVHPLARAKPTVLVLRPSQPLTSDTTPPPQLPDVWDAAKLRCPAGSKPKLQSTLLHPGDDNTQTWLGVEIACLDAGWVLHKQVRLVAEVDAQGQVLRAFGLAWTTPRPLGPPPEAQAMPDVPLQPAILNKRQRWLVGLPHGLQLAQLEVDASATWATDIEYAHAPEPGDLTLGQTLPPELQRRLIVLDQDGVPVAGLANGALDAAGRLPAWHEGAWDAALPSDAPDGIGSFVLVQRVAVPSDVGNLSRAWTRAGVVSWLVVPQGPRPPLVRVAPVPLPDLPLEGLWDCEADVPLKFLACGFHAMGAHANTQVEPVRLQWHDGAREGWHVATDR